MGKYNNIEKAHIIAAALREQKDVQIMIPDLASVLYDMEEFIYSEPSESIGWLTFLCGRDEDGAYYCDGETEIDRKNLIDLRNEFEEYVENFEDFED